ADVDAAGRIVEEEDFRSDLQPLADDDLLLVAAGKLVGRRHRRARLETQPLDLALGAAWRQALAIPGKGAGLGAEDDLADVEEDALVEHQSVAATIGGH